MSNYIKILSIKLILIILEQNDFIVTILKDFIHITYKYTKSDDNNYKINKDEVIDILKETSKTYRLYCNRIKDNTTLILQLNKTSYKYSILNSEIEQDIRILDKLVYNKAIRLLVERNEELNQLVNKEVSKIL